MQHDFYLHLSAYIYRYYFILICAWWLDFFHVILVLLHERCKYLFSFQLLVFLLVLNCLKEYVLSITRLNGIFKCLNLDLGSYFITSGIRKSKFVFINYSYWFSIKIFSNLEWNPSKVAYQIFMAYYHQAAMILWRNQPWCNHEDTISQPRNSQNHPWRSQKPTMTQPWSRHESTKKQPLNSQKPTKKPTRWYLTQPWTNYKTAMNQLWRNYKANMNQPRSSH